MKKILITISAAVCLAAASVNAYDMIEVKGSDTLINVVQRLSEVYMEKNPGKVISVTGGGSGTGVAALINKKCSIANASRAIKGKEIELASNAGVDPKRIIVAIDGLSVIVNANNPLKKLSIDEIGKIYRGEVKNWSELGGENLPITLYGRQSNSGTYDFLKEVVLKGEYSPKMRQMNGNAQIIESVKADKSGIGYVGVGYVKNISGITVLEVARVKNGEYKSSLVPENVISGEYPISRPLYQYVDGKMKQDVKDFILFELSTEGQKIVEEEGFFRISKEYIDYNATVLGK